jgi:hypothetical protein
MVEHLQVLVLVLPVAAVAAQIEWQTVDPAVLAEDKVVEVPQVSDQDHLDKEIMVVQEMMLEAVAVVKVLSAEQEVQTMSEE